MKTSFVASIGLLVAIVLSPSVVRADPPPGLSPPPPSGSPPARAAGSLEEGQHFTLDPVSDGVLTAGAFGFAFLLGEVLSTGEIRPPLPSVTASGLLPIDRAAVTQTIDPNATTYSNIGLYAAIGYAVLDPILSGFRDGTDALIVDGFMYAESGSIALTLTDITKIAVRRPRPIDYINCGTPAQQAGPNCSSTDLGLSFFSGHAAGVSAVSATATYIAFIRSPHSPRPWITLGAGTLLTAFVSFERVRAGAHFPTDVIAGAMAGATVGVLIPHLHRHKEEAPSVWLGVSPAPGGGSLSLQGTF
ncbi:MAG: phosphatase PAP2 family protein [Polyangiaceae bacterium]